MGLLASGLAGFAADAFGRQDTDKEASSTDAAPPTAALAPPVRIATVRVSDVFKEYEKCKSLSERFKDEVMAKKRELAKFVDRAKREADVLGTLTQGTAAYQECEARIKKLKEEHETLRAKCEAEFTRKEAELLAQLYKEIRWATGVIAQERGLTVVLRSPEEANPSDVTNVMTAVSQSLLYVGPNLDITREVVAKLNRGG
jgi:Skp family chaperone for outer membrane proteins